MYTTVLKRIYSSTLVDKHYIIYTFDFSKY